MAQEKLLTQMVAQFRARHGHNPETICIHPIALAALTLANSVAPVWEGIPVKVEEVNPGRSTGTRLGVYVANGAVRGFDL